MHAHIEQGLLAETDVLLDENIHVIDKITVVPFLIPVERIDFRVLRLGIDLRIRTDRQVGTLGASTVEPAIAQACVKDRFVHHESLARVFHLGHAADRSNIVEGVLVVEQIGVSGGKADPVGAFPEGNHEGSVITDLIACELVEHSGSAGLPAVITVTCRESHLAEILVPDGHLDGASEQVVVHGALVGRREFGAVADQFGDGPEVIPPVDQEEIGLVRLAVDAALHRLKRVPVESGSAQEHGRGRPEGKAGVEGKVGPVVQEAGVLDLGLVTAVELDGEAGRPTVVEAVTQRPLEGIGFGFLRSQRRSVEFIEIDRIVLGVDQDGTAHFLSVEIRPVDIAVEGDLVRDAVERFRSGSDLIAVLGLRQGSQVTVRLVETDLGLGDLSVPARQGGGVGKIQDRSGGLDIIKITESIVALRGTDEGAAESGRGYGEQT